MVKSSKAPFDFVDSEPVRTGMQERAERELEQGRSPQPQGREYGGGSWALSAPPRPKLKDAPNLLGWYRSDTSRIPPMQFRHFEELYGFPKNPGDVPIEAFMRNNFNQQHNGVDALRYDDRQRGSDPPWRDAIASKPPPALRDLADPSNPGDLADPSNPDRGAIDEIMRTIPEDPPRLLDGPRPVIRPRRPDEGGEKRSGLTRARSLSNRDADRLIEEALRNHRGRGGSPPPQEPNPRGGDQSWAPQVIPAEPEVRNIGRGRFAIPEPEPRAGMIHPNSDGWGAIPPWYARRHQERPNIPLPQAQYDHMRNMPDPPLVDLEESMMEQRLQDHARPLNQQRLMDRAPRRFR